jgi:hypothetical protein
VQDGQRWPATIGTRVPGTHASSNRTFIIESCREASLGLGGGAAATGAGYACWRGGPAGAGSGTALTRFIARAPIADAGANTPSALLNVM